MLIPNQNIKIKWCNRNRKYYESLGYEFTNYGDCFIVSPKDVPKGSHVKIGFTCDFCEEDFYITAHNYYKNKHLSFGEYKCSKCYQKNISHFSQNERTEYIYNKVLIVCQRYGYNLLTSKEQMLNVNSIIEYECPKHGKKARRAHLFVYGDHICPDCNKEDKRLSVQYVSKAIRDKGSFLMNPNDYQGTTISNLNVLCVNCGGFFITSYNSFMCTRGKDAQCCPNCVKTRSMGEVRIAKYLKDHNIQYVAQKTFKDCVDSKRLPFDFYIPKYNLIIEFDGKQHFEPISFTNLISSKDTYKYVKKHDAIKTMYCFTHGINIIRIPYYDYNQIEKKLESYFYSHEDIV